MSDAYVFDSIDEVRQVAETWLRETNEEQPHDGLGRVLPLTFLARSIKLKESTATLCA